MENNAFKKTFREHVKETSYLSYNEEDYLEAIFNLIQDNRPLTNKELADYLNISRPSVTHMINRLQKKEILIKNDNIIYLSETGFKIGAFLAERHKETEKFLSLIGIQDKKLEKAEKLEHVLDKELLERIKKLNAFLETSAYE
ncbi:MAG: metal-dependent transcriptional regulator [Erysipelotrichales bacterium]|nr:metal-dependent transcriptional regulator [Erysipelotrichales bacterium]